MIQEMIIFSFMLKPEVKNAADILGASHLFNFAKMKI